MVQTAEQKRKLMNKAMVMRFAIEDVESDASTTDASSDIEDDWLNLFARLAEDKSSEELQRLFGRILAGEIRKPGSFSLRTIQLMATISRREAEQLANFLSYAIGGAVPFTELEGIDPDRPLIGPSVALRLAMEELGIAGHANPTGGFSMRHVIFPGKSVKINASRAAISIHNQTTHTVDFSIGGQPLTSSAKEIIPIANLEQTDFALLRQVATDIFSDLSGKYGGDVNAGLIKVLVGVPSSAETIDVIFTASMPTAA
jgi:Protein of unknown function (DUF2806)